MGLERAGMETAAFCEINKIACSILSRHYPGVTIYGDIIKNADEIADNMGGIDVIAGGDPCPIRSKARSNGKSKHPDLSGYFLYLVGRIRPGWVLRENVPAPDDKDFCAALEMLGYRSVIVRTNALSITGQNRPRDFIVGANKRTRSSLESFISKFEDYQSNTPKAIKKGSFISCLTTRRDRYDSRDNFIWEPKNGLRILDSDERVSFAGFPKGWLDGLSESAIARLTGNSICPGVSEIIGRAIMESQSI